MLLPLFFTFAVKKTQYLHHIMLNKPGSRCLANKQNDNSDALQLKKKNVAIETPKSFGKIKSKMGKKLDGSSSAVNQKAPSKLKMNKTDKYMMAVFVLYFCWFNHEKKSSKFRVAQSQHFMSSILNQEVAS